MTSKRKLYTSIFLVLLSFQLVFAPTPAVFAVVEDYIDVFSATGTIFFDPEGCADSGGGGSTSTAGGEAVVSGSTAEEKIWSGLISMNVTEEVAAGIMGNMFGESGFSPARYENKFRSTWESGYDWENDPSESRGVGLIQWSFGRRVNLFKYLREKNSSLVDKYLKKPGTYGGLGGDEFIQKADSPEEANALYSLELSFLIDEMKNNSHYAAVFNETTVSGAAVVFATNVEGCSTCTVGSENTEARRQKAESVFQQYHGKKSFGAGSTGSSGGSGGGGSSSVSSDGSDVTWIGDSITVMTKEKILEKMPKADIYAEVSKSFSHDYGDCHYCGGKSGLTILQGLVSSNKLRDNLVFALGTNDDDVREATIKRIIEIAPNVKRVVLMTNYKINDENAFTGNNAAIKAASSIDQRFVVGDWAQAVSSDPGKYIIADSDSVHPTSEGIPLFVDTMIGALGSTGGGDGGSTSSQECCDPNGLPASDGEYASTKYNFTEGQLRGIVAMAINENGEKIPALKTEISIFANLYEKNSKGQGNGNSEEEKLIYYVRKRHFTGTGWFASSTGAAYNESYNATQEQLDAAKRVLNDGLRNIPPQIVEHDCIYGGACTCGVYRGTNNGAEIDMHDRSQYKRGVTILYQMGGGCNGQWVFWDWANPEEKTGDPFGYYEDNPPSAATTQATKGTSSSKASGSNVVWKDGWIESGMQGYVKEDAVEHFGSVLDPNFGKDYYTDSAKGSGKGPNKILLHSVEGPGGGSSAIHFFSGNGKAVPPHFTVDMKNRKVFQHGSILKASAAIKGETYGDLSAGIQIEILGYTSKSYAEQTGYPDWYLNSDTNFTEEDWGYLAELVNAISVETGIPLDSTVEWEGEGKRLSNEEFVQYKGILAHKHAPGNDHTDIEGGAWERLKAALGNFSKSQQNGCSGGGGATGDVAALQKKLLEFAWPEYKGKDPTRKPEYDAIVQAGAYYHGGCGGNDCGGFVTTMMRESGWDPEYNKYNQNTTGWEDPTPPGSGAKGQLYYLKESDKWENVTSKIHSNADAKPGDVLITIESVSVGHTLLFVGEVPGFSNVMASASYSSNCGNSRAPMADAAQDITYYINGDGMGRKYHVFRKVK